MKQASVWISVFLISNIIFALLFGALGFRINLTDSIPVGLYRITNIKILKNSFVIFCPDNRLAFKQAIDRSYINNGFCPGGYGYLMKKVVGTKGDSISVTPEGVFVNQKLISFSKPKSQDGAGRKLSQWHALNYELKEDEVMAMTSQSEWSFDSRYYGPVHLSQIRGVITPVWVFRLEEK